MAFGIVCTFLLLNLPRIVASSIEVYHSNLILHCIKNEVRYVPSMNYYKLDFFARFFMVVNSAINFLIYCAVSSSFQVRKYEIYFSNSLGYALCFRIIFWVVWTEWDTPLPKQESVNIAKNCKEILKVTVTQISNLYCNNFFLYHLTVSNPCCREREPSFFFTLFWLDHDTITGC